MQPHTRIEPFLSEGSSLQRASGLALRGPLSTSYGFDAVPIGSEIGSVSIAGCPAVCGFAVFHRSKAPMIPIVVGGREIGFGLKLVIPDPGCCSLGHLLSRCGIPDTVGGHRCSLL